MTTMWSILEEIQRLHEIDIVNNVIHSQRTMHEWHHLLHAMKNPQIASTISGESALSMLRRACRLNPPLSVVQRLYASCPASTVTMNLGYNDFTGTPMYFALQSHSSLDVISFLERVDPCLERLAVMRTVLLSSNPMEEEEGFGGGGGGDNCCAALEFALRSRVSLDVVRFILDYDPEKERRLREGRCVLIAIQYPREDVVLYLLEEYAKVMVNTRSDDNEEEEGDDGVMGTADMATAITCTPIATPIFIDDDDADNDDAVIVLDTTAVEAIPLPTTSSTHTIPPLPPLIPTNNLFNTPNDRGDPLLSIALKHSCTTPIIKRLLSSSQNPSKIMEMRHAITGQTPLSTAIRYNASRETMDHLINVLCESSLVSKEEGGGNVLTSLPIINSLSRIITKLPPYNRCFMTADGNGDYHLPDEQERELNALLRRSPSHSWSSALPDNKRRRFRLVFGTLCARVMMQQQQQQRQRVSQAAVRSSNNESDDGRDDYYHRPLPRLWEKLELILRVTGGYPLRRQLDDDFYMLHAAVKCPQLIEHLDLLELIMTVHPEQIRQFDSHGNYPLHVLCSATTSIRLQQRITSQNNIHRHPIATAIQTLLSAYPHAIQIPNKSGDLPLFLAIKNRLSWEDGVNMLFREYVGAAEQRDGRGVYPLFQAALLSSGNDDTKMTKKKRCCCLTTVYVLLREYPGVIKELGGF